MAIPGARQAKLKMREIEKVSLKNMKFAFQIVNVAGEAPISIEQAVGILIDSKRTALEFGEESARLEKLGELFIKHNDLEDAIRLFKDSLNDTVSSAVTVESKAVPPEAAAVPTPAPVDQTDLAAAPAVSASPMPPAEASTSASDAIGAGVPAATKPVSNTPANTTSVASPAKPPHRLMRLSAPATSTGSQSAIDNGLENDGAANLSAAGTAVSKNAPETKVPPPSAPRATINSDADKTPASPVFKLDPPPAVSAPSPAAAKSASIINQTPSPLADSPSMTPRPRAG